MDKHLIISQIFLAASMVCTKDNISGKISMLILSLFWWAIYMWEIL